MTTRELTLERGCASPFSEARSNMGWFHELPGKNGKYHEKMRAEICALGIYRYVDGVQGKSHITLVASDRETPDCFNIQSRGTLDEISEDLDIDFVRWLCGCYRRGLRFIQLEIGK